MKLDDLASPSRAETGIVAYFGCHHIGCKPTFISTFNLKHLDALTLRLFWVDQHPIISNL